MQVAESENLRRNWGSKSCDHNHVEKEFFLDKATGQYACGACGRTFWGEQNGNKHVLSRGN